jgi:polar amino acid transport system substrate-binding protein
LLFCLVSGSAAAASVDDIVFMTEQYPPYNFKVDNKLQGISVDTLVLMLRRTGSKQTREDIKLLPWARGYKRVQTEPDTCLFSTTRSEDRERLFKWVGPVAPEAVGLVARKESNIRIDSVDDIEKHKIGTIRDDVAEQYLINAGISVDKMQRVAETVSNIRKLNRGRIDLWAYDENVAMWELRESGFNPADYESVYVLGSKNQYFACHKGTSDAVIQELQAALDALKADGEYEKILDRYLR